MIERRTEIAVADKKFFNYALGAIGGLAICGLAYGFTKWHKDLQPIIDETAAVQLDIAKLELEKLRRELSVPGSNGNLS